jgi:Tol biopolymer transport system component
MTLRGRQGSRHWAVTLALAGAAAFAALAPAASYAAFPGGNGRIFFNTFAHGRGSISSIRSDGGHAEPVPNRTDHWELDPSVAPDGTIAFVGMRSRDGGDIHPKIYTMDREGNRLRRLTDDGGNSEASFCGPSGGRIVFRGPDNWINVMSPDGSNREHVTRAFHHPEPACSPRGRKVAFVDRRNGRQAIFTVRSNGSRRKRLTSARGKGYATNPDFSPSGKTLVFEGGRRAPGNESGVFTINANGTRQHRLTPKSKPAYDPAFSPNGKEIVFAGGNNGKALFVMRRDGSHIERLAKTTSSEPSPDWAVSLHGGS